MLFAARWAHSVCSDGMRPVAANRRGMPSTPFSGTHKGVCQRKPSEGRLKTMMSDDQLFEEYGIER